MNLKNWELALKKLLHKKNITIFFVTFFLLATQGWASTQNTNKFIEYLLQEKKNLVQDTDSATNIKMPVDEAELNQRHKENEVKRALIDAKITNLESFLVSQKKEQVALSERLKQIHEMSLENPNEALTQEKFEKIKQFEILNNKTIDLLNENLQIAHKYKKVLQQQKVQLKSWQAGFDEERRLTEINTRIKKLYQNKEQLYQKNLELHSEKSSNDNFNLNMHYETKLLLNNQIISLIQLRITELGIQKQIIKADYQLLNNPDLKALQNTILTYKQSVEQLANIEASLKKMFDLLQHEKKLLADNLLLKNFSEVSKTISLRLKEVTEEQAKLKEKIDSKQLQFKHQLSVRQTLSEYYLDSWPIVFNQVVHIPNQFINYLQTLIYKFVESYKQQNIWAKSLFWLGFMSILSFGVILSRFLNKITKDKERQRLSGHLFDGLLILFYRNLPYLTAAAILSFSFFINDISKINYQLLLNLFIVWMVFRNLNIVARLTLLESVSDSSGNDVRLYHRLKWILLICGWSSAVYVFSNQFPFPSLLLDVANRLFMVLLIFVSLVLWSSKKIIPHLLEPFITKRKRYVSNIVNLLSVLVPLTLLISAVIGFLGYINLAWTMIRYQFSVLLVITGFMLARGLVFDALELVSEWMISSLKNGWLWREVLLKPVDKICRLILLFNCGLVFFELFGFNSNSAFYTQMITVGNTPIVQTSGIHITLFSTLEFFLLIFIFTWLAKWTREFCYRWLYAQAKDPGIRNSLSVFTQYAVILIGSFITLRVLGLDFSGMSMILGGLAVGMGFGLRDFASNIIGGLMLLIERPVREGDLITLGEHEGRVSHIGIRSMRISSWDNTEILIPNAEAFNKPFTNWTHQDDVIRTTIPIKVSRSDDPLIVQELIFDVLAVIPEILQEPQPEVYLAALDDALISFEIRYFINVGSNSRFAIKSKVLFAIYEEFKKSKIKAPIPPYYIELLESDHNAKKQKNDERERITTTITTD